MTDYKKVAETLGDIREPYDQETSKAIDAAIALCLAAAGPEDEREHCLVVGDEIAESLSKGPAAFVERERTQARAEGYALGQDDIGGRNFNLFEYDKLQAKYDALVAAAREAVRDVPLEGWSAVGPLEKLLP